MQPMADPILVVWGQNMRFQREALNARGLPKRPDELCMTQRELGERLLPPVHQTTVARWEAGEMEPRRHYKAQIATHLRTDARLLFSLSAVAS